MEFIPTQRTGVMLCYEGYMYTKISCKENVGKHIYWRCVRDDIRKKDRCRGRLHTNTQNNDPEVVNQHNHLPDHSRVYAAKMRQWMKQRALNNGDTPSKIYKEGLSQCSEEVKAHLPSASTCIRMFQRCINQSNYGVLKKILEKSLYDYVKDYCETNIDVRKSEIMSKIREIAQELNFGDFRYSSFWFKSWRLRYNVKGFMVNGMDEERFSLNADFNDHSKNNTLSKLEFNNTTIDSNNKNNSTQLNNSFLDEPQMNRSTESNNFAQEGIQLQMECMDDFVPNGSFPDPPPQAIRIKTARVPDEGDKDPPSDIFDAFDILNKVPRNHPAVPLDMQKGLDLVWRSLNFIFPKQQGQRSDL